uniref:Sulfotransferase domain-containing protein n=1 Tax=Heliothis virescens TaxID=7102 RepID=A0A2A4KA40_HELVI
MACNNMSLRTTWTQELVWLVANHLNYEKAAEMPLAQRFPFLDGFMFYEQDGKEKYIKNLEATQPDFDKEKFLELFNVLKTPVTTMLAAVPPTETRFIKTHLPMSLLPPNILDTAKVVYVARDPRDVAVSCYHHAKLFRILSKLGSVKEFWNVFLKNLYTLTPFFEHLKEAWKMRHHPNMLFLFYEELSQDLPAVIRRVAYFLDKQINEEQITRLCEHLNFKNFKNNKSVNFEDTRHVGLLASDETFIRKGKAGGWRDHFDEEMTQQAERWMEENMRDTDLRFPHPKQ